MFVDNIEVSEGSTIKRKILDPNIKGESFPNSPIDGDVYELKVPYQGKPVGIYKYISSESLWVITHPGFDLLPYDISGSVFGNMNDYDILLRHISVRSYSIPEGFLNCLAYAEKPAVTNTTLKIIKQDRKGFNYDIGTITFTLSENVGVFSQVGTGDIHITAGETLIIKAPNPVDKELADLAFTFAGSLN